MRIARQPRTDTKEGGTLYCIDNRRLFMHKVLCVDSARATACATEVAWMTEFDCKLKQAPPKESDRDRHWRTNDEGIAAAREELNRRLDMAQALHDVSPQALHDVSAGAQMRALVPKKDDELSQYREEIRSPLTHNVDSVGSSETCLLEGVADLNEALLYESLSPPLPIYYPYTHFAILNRVHELIYLFLDCFSGWRVRSIGRLWSTVSQPAFRRVALFGGGCEMDTDGTGTL